MFLTELNCFEIIPLARLFFFSFFREYGLIRNDTGRGLLFRNDCYIAHAKITKFAIQPIGKHSQPTHMGNKPHTVFEYLETC